MSDTKVPAGLAERGSGFWKSTVEMFDLEPAELQLLEEAARVLDLLTELEGLVVADGLMADTGRLHPAVPELRQQRLLLDRLLRALELPVDARSASELGSVAAMARWRKERRV